MFCFFIQSALKAFSSSRFHQICFAAQRQDDPAPLFTHLSFSPAPAPFSIHFSFPVPGLSFRWPCRLISPCRQFFISHKPCCNFLHIIRKNFSLSCCSDSTVLCRNPSSMAAGLGRHILLELFICAAMMRQLLMNLARQLLALHFQPLNFFLKLLNLLLLFLYHGHLLPKFPRQSKICFLPLSICAAFRSNAWLCKRYPAKSS